MKAGIKRTFSPVGATVIWGEWGQYNDMYRGLCGAPLERLFDQRRDVLPDQPRDRYRNTGFKGDAIKPRLRW